MRAQFACVGLLAVLLIPIGTSSLRGLTHILTCQDDSATPFSLVVPDDGPPTISSSTVIERPAPGEAPSDQICGGLTPDHVMSAPANHRAELPLALANARYSRWPASGHTRLDAHKIPIDTDTIDTADNATPTDKLNQTGRDSGE